MSTPTRALETWRRYHEALESATTLGDRRKQAIEAAQESHHRSANDIERQRTQMAGSLSAWSDRLRQDRAQASRLISGLGPLPAADDAGLVSDPASALKDVEEDLRWIEQANLWLEGFRQRAAQAASEERTHPAPAPPPAPAPEPQAQPAPSRAGGTLKRFWWAFAGGAALAVAVILIAILAR